MDSELDNRVTITREELYERLWSTPTVQVAKELGISDVAINKICKRYNIPKPPLGYWAKVQFGQKPKKVELPPLSAPTLIRIYGEASKKQKDLAKALRADTAEQIPVPNELRSPHPLIKKSKKALTGGYVDKYGRVSVNRDSECLDIAVSKQSLNRALRILDALIKALEQKGYTVSITNHPHKNCYSKSWETLVKITGEAIPIRLEEPADRAAHIPSEQEKKRGYYDPYDFSPSGRFVLIVNSYAGEAKKRWSDTQNSLIENQLTSIISALEVTAKAEQIRTEERRKEEVRYQEARLEREQQEARVRNLESLLSSWQRSEEIRSFVDALERRASERSLTSEQMTSLQEWISWAREYAISLDPIDQTLAKFNRTNPDSN